jgi:phospho-N-acetylmuramoyl-pentapeptide-transferase
VTVLIWSALLAFLAVGIFIGLAKRFGWGKPVRRDGPRTHLVKEGTPTMGGAAFILAALITWLLFGERTTDGLAVAAFTFVAALLGWYDDVTSLRRKRLAASSKVDASTGMLARYRLALQAFIALGFAVYAVNNHHMLFGIAWLDVLFYMVVIVGSINAVNFTDGLDGLAGGVVAIILLPFLAFPFAAALLGAILGFLWFNTQPAKVFMGGVGSEGLGAAVAGIAIVSGWVWWLPLIALIPTLEVLSVIIQVAYFRATGGKRFFRMSPLHHHFELSGWSETKVVTRFWLVTAFCVAIAWSLTARTA